MDIMIPVYCVECGTLLYSASPNSYPTALIFGDYAIGLCGCPSPFAKQEKEAHSEEEQTGMSLH